MPCLDPRPGVPTFQGGEAGLGQSEGPSGGWVKT